MPAQPQQLQPQPTPQAQAQPPKTPVAGVQPVALDITVDEV
jgi:hypothetical protein